MARLRTNFVGGTVGDSPLTLASTTLTSNDLANLPVISSPDFMAITLDPDGLFGDPEIVWVTAHTSLATTATITRAQEGTTARDHPQDTPWVHAATAQDFVMPWALDGQWDGTSLTGWTAQSGTWGIDAGYITMTSGGTYATLTLDTLFPINNCVFQADVLNVGGGAGSNRFGLWVGYGSDNLYAPGVAIDNATGGAGPHIGQQAFYGTTMASPAYALDTWFTLRAVVAGTWIYCYVNGKNYGGAYAGADYRQATRVGLWSSQGKARFRNIKLWTWSSGLP